MEQMKIIIRTNYFMKNVYFHRINNNNSENIFELIE